MRLKPSSVIHATLLAVAVLVLAGNAHAAQTKTLHSFNREDGESPLAGLVMDTNHNLYGTTEAGGHPGFGTVFVLSPDGQDWKETVLMNLGGSTGGSPSAPLIFDGAGNLYGTTYYGGSEFDGTVFEVIP